MTQRFKPPLPERDNILARIGEALRLPAPHPGHPHDGGPTTAPAQGADPCRWLPPVPRSENERLALFRKNATDLKAEFHVVPSLDQAAALLGRLRDGEQWKKISTHSGSFTDFIAKHLALPLCRTDLAYDVHELESCDAALTECDALIAQTGSVLVTSRSAGGRSLSVLPPHHVVLAHSNQLLADLPDALALLKKKYAPQYPSFISFITGPSRTGDIERILVLGAHGPRKLTIVLLQQP